MLLIRGTRNGKQKIIGNEVTNEHRVKSVFSIFNFALPLVPSARSLLPSAFSIPRFPFQWNPILGGLTIHLQHTRFAVAFALWNCLVFLNFKALKNSNRQMRWGNAYVATDWIHPWSGEQGWRSGESTRLPPMWPGFESWRRRHMWVEFVVGSLPCSVRFFSGYSGFPLSLKNQHFQIPIRSGTHGHVSTSSYELLSAPWVKQITITITHN